MQLSERSALQHTATLISTRTSQFPLFRWWWLGAQAGPVTDELENAAHHQ